MEGGGQDYRVCALRAFDACMNYTGLQRRISRLVRHIQTELPSLGHSLRMKCNLRFVHTKLSGPPLPWHADVEAADMLLAVLDFLLQVLDWTSLQLQRREAALASADRVLALAPETGHEEGRSAAQGADAPDAHGTESDSASDGMPELVTSSMSSRGGSPLSQVPTTARGNVFMSLDSGSVITYASFSRRTVEPMRRFNNQMLVERIIEDMSDLSDVSNAVSDGTSSGNA